MRTLYKLSNFFDIERLIHSIKTTIAALIGLLLSKIIGFSGGQWTVITIIVVMCAQIYVGSVIQKGYLRFLGTLVGCLFATIALVTMGNSLSSIAITIGISGFLFSYIATTQENLVYAATLGAVTTTIIMLGQQPTVLYAGERFIEISIGILIATLVSQFFLPIHARTHLRRIQGKTLAQLRERYIACMVDHHLNDETYNYEELDEGIVNLLMKQRQLAKEAVREPLGESYDPELFLQSLYAEKEILRCIDFMRNALLHMQNNDVILTQSDALKKFNDDTVKALDVIIEAAQAEKYKEMHIHAPTLVNMKKNLMPYFTSAKPEDWLYINGFLFGAELLIENLTRLAKLYKITIYETSATAPLQLN